MARTQLSDISAFIGKNLTENYPHTCFECGRKILFADLLCRNQKLYTREQLEKLWKCKRVYFYCCSCFRKKEIEEKQVAKNKRLIKKAKRICKKFGFNLKKSWYQTEKGDEGCLFVR